MTVATVDPAVCPDCGTPLDTLTIHQPALVRHAGYGGTQRRTTLHCPRCTWTLTAAVDTVAPERRPWCGECGLPLLDGAHTHHPGDRSCGIDHDGCTCPQLHGWCCETCKETP